MFRKHAFTILLLLTACAHSAPRFEITLDPELTSTPFTGRVYLFFTAEEDEDRAKQQLQHAPAWFDTEPFVSIDVTGLKPGTPLTISSATPGLNVYPKDFRDLDLTGMWVMACARLNPYERRVVDGPGNVVSAPVRITQDEAEVTSLQLSRTIRERPFIESDRYRLFSVESESLTKFHGRPVSITASVVLPQGYATFREKTYPVIYAIPGFTGDHRMGRGVSLRPPPAIDDVNFIRVYLDPNCPLGHHVFADSANNGPVGTAFVKEFIPALERKYRVIAKPHARLLTGHSSGGWSSLWLQIRWPEFFGGVWSTAPDPVDFSEFSGIDIYNPESNLYRDADGNRRPIARMNGKVRIWLEDFCRLESVLGHGGQMHSFEAVFSPRLSDGSVRPMWNWETGQIDPVTANAWKKYDIRLYLQQHPELLKTSLAGKLHVHTGDQDNFFLAQAVVRLKETLDELQSDAVIEIHEGRDHFTVITPELVKTMRQQMTSTFLKGEAKAKSP